MPASKAQQKAVAKYMKNNYDNFQLRMPKGNKDIIKAHAESNGESVNGFINRAIDEAMERDKADTGVITMCTFCGGKLKPDITEYIEKQGNYIVVIKNVPCEKCEQCGEVYFSNEVVQVIEKILDTIQYISSELTVTVIDYNTSKVA